MNTDYCPENLSLLQQREIEWRDEQQLNIFREELARNEATEKQQQQQQRENK